MEEILNDISTQIVNACPILEPPYFGAPKFCQILSFFHLSKP